MSQKSAFLGRLWFGLLLAALFFAPWLGGGFDGSGPPIGRALAAAAVLLWMLDGGGRVEAPLAITLWAVFVAWCVLTVTASIHLHGSVTTLSDYVTWGGVALVVSSAGKDPDKRIWLLAALLGSLALLGGYGVKDGLTNVEGWRIFGPFNTPNLYASYLITLLPLALFVSLRPTGGPENAGSRRLRMAVAGLGMLALWLGGTALLMTGSKGAALALAVAVLAAVVVTRGWRGVSRKSLAVVAALLAVSLLVGGKVLAGRVGAAATAEAHSGTFRRLTWQATGRMAAANPILGVGVGAFGASFGRYAIAGWTAAAHNAYLQTAAETGVPGAALFIAALAVAAWSLRKQAGEGDVSTGLFPRAALAGLLAAAAHNLVDYGWAIWAPGVALWALIGLGLSAARPVRWPKTAAFAFGLAVAAVFVTAALTANAQTKAAMVEGDSKIPPLESARSLAAARRLDPLDARLAVDEGRAWLAAGNAEEARRCLRRAVSLNPGDATAWRYYAELDGDPSLYRKGLRYSPNSLKLMAGLARAEQARGNKAAAMEQWRAIIRVADGPVGRCRAIPQIVEVEPVEAHVALALEAWRAGDKAGWKKHLAAVNALVARYDALRARYPLQWQALGRGGVEEVEMVHRFRDETASPEGKASPNARS
jgi:O-antigen ligase